MSIQYGSTPITDIKYCDPQGTLKSIQRVRRNGANIWTAPITSPNYLKFTALDGEMYIVVGYATGTDVMVRYNGGQWRPCYSGDYLEFNAAGDYYEIKGIGVTTARYQHFDINGYFNASGSVTSLTDGFGADPNVELSDGCYAYMFSSSYPGLMTAPELPAINLASGCYYRMFNNCSGLVSAPLLPATDLVYSCYGEMFYKCRNLTSITSHQSAFNDGCTDWISSDVGTFHCTPTLATALTDGTYERTTSTVPSGWTVIGDVI